MALFVQDFWSHWHQGESYQKETTQTNLVGGGPGGLGLAGEEPVGEVLDEGLEDGDFLPPDDGRSAERAAGAFLHPLADAEAAEHVAATQHRRFDEDLER